MFVSLFREVVEPDESSAKRGSQGTPSGEEDPTGRENGTEPSETGDRQQLYIHMSAYDGSEKQERIDGPTPVSLVVSQYEQPDRWRSVIVDGTLVELTADAVEQRDVLRAFTNSGLASVDVFNRSLSDVSFTWHALEPSSITGRHGVRSR
ncbi:pyridoxamine 5'-phosphate oxidase family protein [Natrialbaceae archaeon A-gly3]